jgi:hypothetical protein
MPRRGRGHVLFNRQLRPKSTGYEIVLQHVLPAVQAWDDTAFILAVS